MNDPFEAFERSRAGLLIPVVLFVFGAIATVWMVNTVIEVDSKIAEKEAANNPALVEPVLAGSKASANDEANDEPNSRLRESATPEMRPSATEGSLLRE